MAQFGQGSVAQYGLANRAIWDPKVALARIAQMTL